MSKIEWTDITWNPTTGCDKVSEGCGMPRWEGDKPGGCYAMDMAKRLKAMGQPKYQNDGDPGTSGAGFLATEHADTLDAPLKWADIRIPALLDTPAAVRFLSCEPLLGAVDLFGRADEHGHRPRLTYWLDGRPGWGPEKAGPTGLVMRDLVTGPRIDWVICGGESGPGARPMHPDWARRLRDQCTAAGVPFLLKQWGEWAPESVCATHAGAKSALYIELDGSTRPAQYGARGGAITVQRNGKDKTGRWLDGYTHDEFPEVQQ